MINKQKKIEISMNILTKIRYENSTNRSFIFNNNNNYIPGGPALEPAAVLRHDGMIVSAVWPPI